jgi:hypothetical protein
MAQRLSTPHTGQRAGSIEDVSAIARRLAHRRGASRRNSPTCLAYDRYILSEEPRRTLSFSMKTFIRTAALLATAMLFASPAPAREIPAGAGASANVTNAPAPRESRSKKPSHVGGKSSSGSTSKKQARSSPKQRTGTTHSKKSKQSGHTKASEPTSATRQDTGG